MRTQIIQLGIAASLLFACGPTAESRTPPTERNTQVRPESHEILDIALSYLLNRTDLRQTYSAKGEKRFVLDMKRASRWPRFYRPSVAGFTPIAVHNANQVLRAYPPMIEFDPVSDRDDVLFIYPEDSSRAVVTFSVTSNGNILAPGFKPTTGRFVTVELSKVNNQWLVTQWSWEHP